jgi:hypothetical protein
MGRSRPEPRDRQRKDRKGGNAASSARFDCSEEALALLVERIGVVGTTEHGEHIGLQLTFSSEEQATVLFPHAMLRKLMAALAAAGSAAYDAQVSRLGSEANVLLADSPEPILPTDFELGRGKALDGRDMLLMRLKKDSLPIVDAAFSYAEARRLAAEILVELLKGPAPPKSIQ